MHGQGITLWAPVAAALTLGVLWHLQRPIIVAEGAWKDVKAEARSGGYRLITMDFSYENLSSILLDLRLPWIMALTFVGADLGDRYRLTRMP